MTCFGIDPSFAKPIAWACRMQAGKWHYGIVQPDRVDVFFALFEKYKPMGIDCVVVEGGYVGPNERVALGLENVRGQRPVL